MTRMAHEPSEERDPGANIGNIFKNRYAAPVGRGDSEFGVGFESGDFAQLHIGDLHFRVDGMALNAGQLEIGGAARLLNSGTGDVIELEP